MEVSKILIVVDMQNDFVSGALGSDEVKQFISKEASQLGGFVQNDC